MKKFKILLLLFSVGLSTIWLSSCTTGNDDLDRCIYKGDCEEDENASLKPINEEIKEKTIAETPSKKNG